MNKRQKIVVAAATFIVALIAIFPPHAYPGQSGRFAGHYFIFTYNPGGWEIAVSLGALFAEVFIVLIVSTGLCLLLGRTKASA